MFFVDRWPSGVGIGGLGGGGVVGLFMAAWVVSSLCMCGSVPAGSRRGSGTVVCGQNNVVHVKWFLPTRSMEYLAYLPRFGTGAESRVLACRCSKATLCHATFLP